MFGRLRSHSSHINYPVQSDALKMESPHSRRPLTSPPPPFFSVPKSSSAWASASQRSSSSCSSPGRRTWTTTVGSFSPFSSPPMFSERRSLLTRCRPFFSSAHSQPGGVCGDRRAGRSHPGDQLVALRLGHGLRGGGGAGDGFHGGLHCALHSAG